MINYIVNDLFNKDLFIECLSSIDVDAYKTNNGVALDRDKLLSMPKYKIPHMIFMNLDAIKSEYHTEEI